jgi:hypothetical protein
MGLEDQTLMEEQVPSIPEEGPGATQAMGAVDSYLQEEVGQVVLAVAVLVTAELEIMVAPDRPLRQQTVLRRPQRRQPRLAKMLFPTC